MDETYNQLTIEQDQCNKDTSAYIAAGTYLHFRSCHDYKAQLAQGIEDTVEGKQCTDDVLNAQASCESAKRLLQSYSDMNDAL
jgi:hypothetical protein